MTAGHSEANPKTNPCVSWAENRVNDLSIDAFGVKGVAFFWGILFFVWTPMNSKHQFFVDLSNFPNKLCVSRLIVILISVICFLCGLPVIAAFVGLAAGITDKIDGLYARKHNMCTELGSLLDQISDLIFNFFVIGAAAVMGVWPIWILFLWGFRDLSVLSMRTSAGQLGFSIPSSFLGKVATFEMFVSEFFMPLDWALNSTKYTPDMPYRFADFVQAHFHPYFCFGFHIFTLLAILIGIVMQYVSAAKYAKHYIQKYDEIHKAKAKLEENSDSGDHHEISNMNEPTACH